MQCFFLACRQLGTKIWNGHVPASQHATFRAHLLYAASRCIKYLNLMGRIRISEIANMDDRTVKTKTNRRMWLVQAAVIRVRGYDIFDRATRQSVRDQPAHQKPCD